MFTFQHQIYHIAPRLCTNINDNDDEVLDVKRHISFPQPPRVRAGEVFPLGAVQ